MGTLVRAVPPSLLGMTGASDSQGPYESTNDLPSMVEAMGLYRVARFVSPFLGRGVWKDLSGAAREVKQMARDMDELAAMLVPRNWVMFGALSHALHGIVTEAAGDAEVAERLLAAHLSDVEVLKRYLLLARHRPGLRERQPLIDRALNDQAGGRHYSVVNLLLAVVDGYVSDLNPAARKGYHAKDSEEMRGWDSVISVHDGLRRAHASYAQRFDKLETGEVFELHRHGIVHGMIVNYDNTVVSGKAWCHLFAAVEWAESLEKQKKEEAKPPKPTSVREAFGGLARDMTEHRAAMALTKEGLDAWSARSVSPDDASFGDDEVKVVTEKYLSAWKLKQVGIMVALTQINMRDGTDKKMAGDVKADIADFELSDFTVTGIAYTAPAMAEATVSLVLNGETKPGTLEWVWEDADGRPTTLNVEGDWHLQNSGPWLITAPRRRPPRE